MARATSRLENFTKNEVEGLNPKLRVMLQATRYLAGVPIYVTSGLRPGDDGEHGEGDGVDISDNPRGDPISSRWRDKVLEASYRVGFRRRGVYDRHVHLGVSDSRDQDVTWIGRSR